MPPENKEISFAAREKVSRARRRRRGRTRRTTVSRARLVLPSHLSLSRLIRAPRGTPIGKARSPTSGRAGRRAHRLSFRMELVVLRRGVRVRFVENFRTTFARGRHLTSALLDSAVAATAAMMISLSRLALVCAVGYAMRRDSAFAQKVVHLHHRLIFRRRHFCRRRLWRLTTPRPKYF